MLIVILQIHWSEPEHGGAESVHVSGSYRECTGATVQLFSQVVVNNLQVHSYSIH